MWNINYVSHSGDKGNDHICQDCCYETHSEEVQVLSVCDGASSGNLSHIGADFISKFVAEFFLLNFDEIWLSDSSKQNMMICKLHQEAIKKLSDHVQSAGYPPILQNNHFIINELLKYSTTIQLIAIKENKALFYKVGNGATFLVDNNHISVLSESAHDEETKHFTYPDTIDTILDSELFRFELKESVSGFIITTDGVDFKDGLYDEAAPTQKCIELFNNIVSIQDKKDVDAYLSEFVHSISSFNSNVAKDDISIGIIYRENSQKIEDITIDSLDKNSIAIPLGTGKLVISDEELKKNTKKAEGLKKIKHKFKRVNINELGEITVFEESVKKNEKEIKAVIDEKLSVYNDDIKKINRTIKQMRIFILSSTILFGVVSGLLFILYFYK